MPSHLLVEPLDDNAVIEHVFLLQLMRKHLTDREHAVLALRASKYTRSDIVTLLGIGRTTVYTTEHDALEKLRNLYRYEEKENQWPKDTSASSANGPLPGSLPSAPAAKTSTGEPAENGPTG